MIISVKAFQNLGEAEVNRAKELIRRCERVIAAIDRDKWKAMGAYGQELQTLWEYAEEHGKACSSFYSQSGCSS